MDAEEVHRAAGRGDFTQVVAAIAALDGAGTPVASAWSLALRSRLSLVDPRVPPFDLAWMADFDRTDPAQHEALVHACVDAALRLLFDLDVAALGRLAEVSADLAAVQDEPRARVCLASVRAWCTYLSNGHCEGLEAITEDASRAGLSDLVVVTTSQRALAALSDDAVADAVALARRASRMARTEGILAPEYLANLVLARIRRHTGMPHLAARILAALGAVVPAPLCGLVAWELLLAGADSSAHEVLAGAVPGARPTVATRAASGLLGAAWRGDEASFTDAATRLQRATEGVALLARDAASLLSAIDPHADPDTLPKDTREWVAGALPITPPALCGLCMPDVDDDGNEIAGAFVLLRTDADARRVLRPALGLVDPSAARGHSLAHARTNTALSILAFAGSEGLTDRELFHAVYGFEYEPAQHGSALRQLVRRMREEIGDRAAIDRTGGGYALLPLVTCAIPDPRCAPETDELILRFLAARGGRASAREVATALGIALRTVQLALKHLVDDGACEAVRKGRAVEYELEDTTFANPTLTRLSPKGA